ncbi:MAG TPA: Gfo/Idh/MocA family oxidoreductase [Anaerolineaceae bacterium]|nr:Gfo/Idh/MocA family oxidoreductase [Anaerolineaceae bacterium]HPN53340.1 Gfo/Idh/MocA family oxidoreductase [Anaerolineaceae bacterium]
MRFLIAGLGSIGRRHLRNLLALGEEDILLYRTHRSTLPDDELSRFPVETDLSAALAHKPDAVIISNPTSLHMDVALPAAEAGCALFLEKPISHNLERMDQLEAALQNSGKPALVGFQFRFNPGLRTVRQMLDEQRIGRPLSVRAHWGEYLPGWHPWEDYRQSYSARADLGGGVVLTLSHPLDYLRWLLGEAELLAAVTAQLGGLDVQVEDTAEMLFSFESGALGSLHLDYNQRPASHWLEITGSEGMLRWENADASVKWINLKTGQWQTVAAPEGFERNVMFLDQMAHFRAVVRGEAQPICTLQDGRRALELALQVLDKGIKR